MPIAFTNASSRLVQPVAARSSSGVPSAATRPRAMTTIRSQSCATSCMMWLDSSTQRPSSRSASRNPRSDRVVMTSRPLVGSSSSTLRGSCTSARAIAVLVRWPCEKPSARRSMKSCIPSASTSRPVRCAIRLASIPCSWPKYSMFSRAVRRL